MDYSLHPPDVKPTTLYHYTSLAALTSIVQSKKIRASNIRFLNDSSESLWLKNQVAAALRKRSHSVLEEETISRIVTAIETRAPQSLFVASFTENADDLSQWRAYCPSGLGVSIGFSTECLDQQWVANPRGEKPFFLSALLQKVRYHSPKHGADLERAVNILVRGDTEGIEHDLDTMFSLPPQWMTVLIRLAMNLESGGESASIGEVAIRALPTWLALLSPFIKHDAFQGEAEWRKVVSKDYRLMPGQQFRQGTSTLIPFVEVMLDVMTEGFDRVPQRTYFINEVVVAP